jgi:glycosyltransferase
MLLTVSLITVVYNGARTIADCLNSVALQNCACEHIIIDGGSSDRTLAVVGEFPHVSKIVSEPDNGVYDAMNKGIRLATGDIIGILNADDKYADDSILATVIRTINVNNLDSCYGDLIYVDNDDIGKVKRYWRSKAYNDRLFYRGWMPPHPTFFVRKSIYDQFGVFDQKFGTAADYELMLRFLVKHKITTKYIPKTLVKMRCGGLSNNSLRSRLKANRSDRLSWAANGLTPGPLTLYLKPLSKLGQWIRPYVIEPDNSLIKSNPRDI